MMSFKVADLQRDADLLTRVKQIASQIATDPQLSDAIIQRWLGRDEQYASV